MSKLPRLGGLAELIQRSTFVLSVHLTSAAADGAQRHNRPVRHGYIHDTELADTQTDRRMDAYLVPLLPLRWLCKRE